MAGRTPVGRGRYRTGRNPDAARQHRPARDRVPLRISLAGAFTCCSPGPVRFRTRRYTCGSETIMKTTIRILALAACAAGLMAQRPWQEITVPSVSYTHLRAHETRHDLVCRLLLEKKKN